MNEEEFGRALKLKATNPDALKNDQLSVYGMGLKYASVYLGNHYSISSTAYNSDIRYFAEIDVPKFETNNPTSVPAKLNSENPEVHETVVTITDLRIKRTPAKENDLREKLGTIYNHYMHSGTLSIFLNNIPVVYHLPELRPNENGGRYYSNFNDSFTINGKTYNFSGWIGILNKGNQSITGLNLIQANRCIELGYKPEKLFGKGNSFQNSRVVGEVVFNGDNYVLSFNKDKFVWADDGAEDAFINKLKSNSDVACIIKTSKKISFTDDEEKAKEKTSKSFTKSSVISVINEPKVDSTLILNTDDSTSTDTTNQPTTITAPVTTNKYIKFQIVVEDKNVPLYVDTWQGSKTDDWIIFEKYEDGYLLRVNYENEFICNKFSTQKSKVASNTIAIVIVTSMLMSQNLGVKLTDSKTLLKTINKIMGEKNE